MFAPSGVISESCSYTRWRLGLFIFPSELQKKEVWQLKKHKFIFYLTLFIGVEAVLFLLGLFLAGGVKNGFIVSFQLIPTAFPDRKSTRLNSSHLGNSYSVFCL